MLMDLAMVGNMEGLLDLVPDSVVEKVVERKQQMRWRLTSCAQTGLLGDMALRCSLHCFHMLELTATFVPLQPLRQIGES